MNWVFIRGLTRGKSHWGDFSKQFQEFFPDSTITFLDLPGNGELNRHSSPTSVQKLLEFTRKNNDLSKIESPRYVLGFSLGGMVTLEWLNQFPNEFDGAVLINTSASNLNPFYQRFRLKNVPLVVSSLLKGKKDWEEMIWTLTTRIAKDKEKVLASWKEQAKGHPVSSLNALKQLYAASRYKFRGEKPKSPLLFLAGRQDQLVHPLCTGRLAHYLQAPLRIHASAGHDLTLEDPKWVLKTIQDWLLSLHVGHED